MLPIMVLGGALLGGLVLYYTWRHGTPFQRPATPAPAWRLALSIVALFVLVTVLVLIADDQSSTRIAVTYGLATIGAVVALFVWRTSHSK